MNFYASHLTTQHEQLQEAPFLILPQLNPNPHSPNYNNPQGYPHRRALA